MTASSARASALAAIWEAQAEPVDLAEVGGLGWGGSVLSCFLPGPGGCARELGEPADLGAQASDEVRRTELVELPADGRGVAGRYLCGHAGWFYDPETSVPVLGPELLLKLRDALV